METFSPAQQDQQDRYLRHCLSLIFEMEFYHHFSKIEYFIPRNNLGGVKLHFLVKNACFAWCICAYANISNPALARVVYM